MPDYEFRIPAPYPGAGSPRLSMQGADLIVSYPPLGQDAMPRAALPGASGGRARDQDPDDGNITIANSPAHAAMLKLCQFLSDRLGPDDMSEVQTMLQDLFSTTANGEAVIAGDRRLRTTTQSYSQRFPHADRLYKRTFG